MGQGQEVHARRLVTQCQTQGGWALLQNTHLALDFLTELLATVLETEKVHDDFRLWLTTEVHDKYPINLLQSSIKFTYEPPQGVKAGLKKTFTNTLPGEPGLLQSTSVEANALHSGLPPHHSAGETQVWSSRMEHPLRV